MKVSELSQKFKRAVSPPSEQKTESKSEQKEKKS